MSTASADQVTVREGASDETTCNCCGAPTFVHTGYLDVDASSAGWYTAGHTPDRPDHRPLVRLYIGDWTDQAGPDERWGLRIGLASDGPVLLDWEEREIEEARPVFTPLGRVQVLGTPLEPQLWTMLDKVLTHDSRLKDLTQ